MTAITAAIEIAILRRKARRLYLKIHDRADGLSCGAHLADFIRPDIPVMEAEFNKTMRRLAELDPKARKLIEKHGEL